MRSTGHRITPPITRETFLVCALTLLTAGLVGSLAVTAMAVIR